MPNTLLQTNTSESRRRTQRRYKIAFTGVYTQAANGKGGETLNLTVTTNAPGAANTIAGLFDPVAFASGKYSFDVTRMPIGLEGQLYINPTATSWANALQLMVLSGSDAEEASAYAYTAAQMADYGEITIEGPSRMF